MRLETKNADWKHKKGNMQIGNIKIDQKHENKIGNKKRRLETKQVDWKQKRTLETIF